MFFRCKINSPVTLHLCFIIMAKTYDYLIVLKKKSFSVIDNISKLMLLMAIAAFLFTVYATLILHTKKLESSLAWFLLVISLVIIGWWILCENQLKRGLTPYFRFAMMASAFGWFVVPSGMYISIIYIVALFFEKSLKVAPEIAFDDEEIVFNGLIRKRYSWAVVNNVVLKDGLLTIDLKNNTLIQKEVNDEVSPEIEEEFNSFCKSLHVNTSLTR